MGVFYNKGKIHENLLGEQAKLIKFNHLVANLIILHNTNKGYFVRVKRPDYSSRILSEPDVRNYRIRLPNKQAPTAVFGKR